MRSDDHDLMTTVNYQVDIDVMMAMFSEMLKWNIMIFPILYLTSVGW